MKFFLFIISSLFITSPLYADEELFQAIDDNNIAKTKYMVEIEKTNVNQPNEHGQTPLLRAASKRSKITEILLEAGADPNIEDSLKVRPLHRAVEAGHIKNAELLLEAGAEVDATDRWRETALIIAAQNKDPKMVELLLRYKPDVTISNNRNQTAITIARKHRNPEIYNMLTEITKISPTARILDTIRKVIGTGIEDEPKKEKFGNICPY